MLAKTKCTPVVFVGSLNSDDMMVLASKASLFIGVHTPLLHIAASQNTPTISIFGQDDVKVFGPWDGDTKDGWYVSKAARQKIGKHTVLHSTMSCTPCNKNSCDDGSAACLHDVNIKQLKNEIENYIGGVDK